MTGRDLVREALDSLAAHRLRATLSAVGVVTGVATVVAALAIADGARQQAVAEIGRLGIRNVIARATTDTESPGRTAPVLTTDDAAAIARRFPGADVSALRRLDADVRLGDFRVPATIAGVTPSWRATADLRVATGRWLAASDLRLRTAVVGGHLARALFGGDDPIGQLVQAAGEWRTVVGVLEAGDEAIASGGSTSTLQSIDPDRTLFVPMPSLDVSLGSGDTGTAVNEIVLRVAAGGDVVRAGAAASAALAARHDGAADRFRIVVPRQLLNARLRSERHFHVLLLAIGAIALVISGVGIMNIMMASVAERAVEIGVRRAFGAPRRAILWQFAAEAGVLSAAAGVAGLPLGIVAATVTAWVAGWPVAISPVSLVVALGLALVVGLGAGLYPARLATDLSPTDALRS